MLLVGSFFLPLIPVRSQTTIPIFKIGEIGDSMGNWDGVAATAGIATMYSGEALEPLMMQPENWDGDHATLIPCLATQMDLINWPTDTNGLGWEMSGGVKAIEFTLRSGVTFHDGSAFNATVAKWNIDRNMVISGNLTGKLTVSMVFSDFYKALYSWWLPAYDWAPYETTAWNVSQFIGQPAAYAEYGVTKSLVWNNTGIYTGWQYDMFDSVYPRIKNVTIIDDFASGGKIRVNYNDWSGVFLYVDDAVMVSMDAYKEDYDDTPIYGAGDVAGFLQPDVTGGYPATGFPGHMIGTGPYRFIEHDETLQQGTMVRYDNYWNSTALQVYGLHEVPELAIITFPSSDLGFSQQSIAMVTGTIDYAGDGGQLVYGDMIADPDINYIETGVGADRNFITLNGINETYWKTWDDNDDNVTALITDKTYLYDIDDVTEQVTVDGINRAMRKAVSYVFDYDIYIDTIEAGRAVRSGGFLGINNEFYNPSIPLAYRDLTIARQALIDDPSWNAILTDRGLDITNTTAQWRAVAATNPVFEFKLLWDLGTYDLASLFGNNIKDLGMVLGGLNGAPDGNLLVQPDIYTVLYSDDLGTVPWFTTHGVTTSWPGIDYKMIPVLEYYVASPGDLYGIPSYDKWFTFPDAALTNLGFHYNDTIDEYIKKGWFANRTTLQELYDNMTIHFQTYQYSDIMISHSKYGIALDKNWEYTPLLGYEFVKYVGGADDGTLPVPIPGFETAIILTLVIITSTGIGYSVKRKRKHA